jgi:hypothetical protein
VRLEGLRKLKIIHLNGTRTRDLPACSIVPQPTTLPRTPYVKNSENVRKHRDRLSCNDLPFVPTATNRGQWVSIILSRVRVSVTGNNCELRI